jgi:2-haloacid dehalogenase
VSNQPSILVFDIGNVLIDWDPRHLYRRIFDDPDEMEQFLAGVCTPAWNIEQDRGRPFAVGEDELIARFPHYALPIRAYFARWIEMVPGAIAGSAALLERARRAGIPDYAITNFSRETFPLAQARYPFLTGFKGIVVSGEEGLIKPDPAIFTLFLERYGLAAEACLFIDDSAANVASARAIGMAAIHFSDPDQLEKGLRDHGFPL